jgi:hypothetical protein
MELEYVVESQATSLPLQDHVRLQHRKRIIRGYCTARGSCEATAQQKERPHPPPQQKHLVRLLYSKRIIRNYYTAQGSCEDTIKKRIM